MTVSLIQKKEPTTFTQEQTALIKNYLCKDINDDELKLFAAVCHKTGLDPFMKQIYAVKRSGQMTIQTSIDGYRLIAERTGRYAPGKESTYSYKGEVLVSATSYVKKRTSDGTWHEVAASAFLEEYRPNYKNQFWETKQHIMLAKCAESLALRKAFPNELSGLYSEDEMHQASNTIKATVNDEQAEELLSIFDKCSSDIQEKMNQRLQGKGINSFYQLPLDCYLATKEWMSKKMKEYQDSIVLAVKEA